MVKEYERLEETRKMIRADKVFMLLLFRKFVCIFFKLAGAYGFDVYICLIFRLKTDLKKEPLKALKVKMKISTLTMLTWLVYLSIWIHVRVLRFVLNLRGFIHQLFSSLALVNVEFVQKFMI